LPRGPLSPPGALEAPVAPEGPQGGWAPGALRPRSPRPGSLHGSRREPKSSSRSRRTLMAGAQGPPGGPRGPPEAPVPTVPPSVPVPPPAPPVPLPPSSPRRAPGLGEGRGTGSPPGGPVPCASHALGGPPGLQRPSGDRREKAPQDSGPLGTPALKAWVAGGLGAISRAPPVGPQGPPRLFIGVSHSC